MTDITQQEQVINMDIPVEGDKRLEDVRVILPTSFPQEMEQVQTEAKKEEFSTLEHKPRQDKAGVYCDIHKAYCEEIQPMLDIKPKHVGGRPCEFCQRKEEVLTKTRAYLDAGKGDKPKMVYLNELAIVLDVYKDIVTDWANKTKEDDSLEHPEFNRLIKELQAMQELRLQQRLLGRYNPTGAIFLLKTKHKYIETEKKLLANADGEKLQIEFIEQKPDVRDE